MEQPSPTERLAMLMGGLCKGNCFRQLINAAPERQQYSLQADQHSMGEQTSSFNQEIRPLLDTIDELRILDVSNIGIQLPSMVVIGDQSSGKSSVLESLAEVSLPKGMNMCTKMPLVLQMKDHPSPNIEMQLIFGAVTRPVSAESIEEEVRKISDSNARNGISHKEINLIISRKGMPNLTLIDLPGITRVAVDGQPENIGEQICELIMKYITQKDTIILNVLQASVDFSTCESIKMSRQVDKDGKRTLAVVTKADKHPEGLARKVKEDTVKIGLGYVCVRNRLEGEYHESHEATRKKEDLLFRTPPLSAIDRKMVGIPMLLNRLLQIQEQQIRECLPSIASQIKNKLEDNVIQLKKLPLLPKEDAKKVFDELLEKLIKSLEMLLVRGEFQDYPNDKDLHCTARINEKIEDFYEKLKAKYPDLVPEGRASPSQITTDIVPLQEEFYQLKETQGPWLRCTLPRNAFITLLHARMSKVAHLPKDFMEDVWGFVETAVEKVIDDKFQPYSQMKQEVKKAAKNVLKIKMDFSIQRMSEMVEMEKHIDYTCNPEYESKLEDLKKKKDSLLNAASSTDLDMKKREEAFNLWLKMAAYWKIVVMRIVDVSAMHLLISIKQLINAELKSGISKEVLGNDEQGLQKMTSEEPETAELREELEQRIHKLKRAKEKVASVLLAQPSA